MGEFSRSLAVRGNACKVAIGKFRKPFANQTLCHAIDPGSGSPPRNMLEGFVMTETTTTTLTEVGNDLSWPNPYDADLRNPHWVEGWPISPNMRKAMLTFALEKCGLDADGNPLVNSGRVLTNRDRIEGMRMIATFERISLEIQGVFTTAGIELTDADLALGKHLKLMKTPANVEITRAIIEAHPVLPDPDRLTPEGAAKRNRERAEKLLEDAGRSRKVCVKRLWNWGSRSSGFP